MDIKISEICNKIRALRVFMLEAEDVMHDQIRRDEECSEVAGQFLTMRAEIASFSGINRIQSAAAGRRATFLESSHVFPTCRRPVEFSGFARRVVTRRIGL